MEDRVNNIFIFKKDIDAESSENMLTSIWRTVCDPSLPNQPDENYFYLVREAENSGVLYIDYVGGLDFRHPEKNSMIFVLLNDGWEKINDDQLYSALNKLANISPERTNEYVENLMDEIQQQLKQENIEAIRVDPLAAQQSSNDLYMNYVETDKKSQEIASLVQKVLSSYQEEQTSTHYKEKMKELPEKIYAAVTHNGLFMKDPVTLAQKDKKVMVDGRIIHYGESCEKSELEKRNLQIGRDFYPNQVLKKICALFEKAFDSGNFEKLLENIDEELKDPIELERIKHAPHLSPPGHSYEMIGLITSAAKYKRDPMTNLPISASSTIPNKNVEEIIENLPELERFIHSRKKSFSL